MAITVAKNGDLTIEVVEYDENVHDDNERGFVEKRHDFIVSREVLLGSSNYFTKLLLSPNFREARKNFITLYDDSVASMNIWFRILHGAELDYDVKIDEIWHLAAAGKKYDLDVSKLNAWFAKWYEKQPIDRWYELAKSENAATDPRCLLYPCWLFDHAKGFLRITKFMSYNYTGHLMERNPTRFYDLRLPSRVIRKSQRVFGLNVQAKLSHAEELNAAKGRLKTIIHRGLFTPNEKLLKATCSCKEVTLFNYEKALYTIQVWPLERVALREPMTTIIERLNKFHFEAKKNACVSCRSDYQRTVGLVRDNTRNYFDGLCLDCMDSSNPKTGDDDVDYWLHNDLNEDQRVRGCRHEHGQPTWYFSFMGRKETRDQYRRVKRMRRYEGDSE